MFGPVVPFSGPRKANILLIGEAPGEHESEEGRPFVGAAGWLLRTTLKQVGLDLRECRVTNVFSRQPENNDVTLYGVPKADPRAALALGPMHVNSNKTWFLNIEHIPELERLWQEIEECGSNIIIPMGNTACWSLGLGLGISDLRGTVYPSSFLPQTRQWKCLPTLHPAAVLRNWKDRPYLIADLQKVANESHTGAILYDEVQIEVPETLDELHLLCADALGKEWDFPLACDIETMMGQITCIGFALHPGFAFCVPIWDKDNPERPNYWGDKEDEAWWGIRQVLESPRPKLFQNGLYDLQYIRLHGISPVNCLHDTMLAHHSLWPEMRKSLGILGSIYANVPGWKRMRTFQREERFKRDE